MLADVYVGVVLSQQATAGEPETIPEMTRGLLPTDLLDPEIPACEADGDAGDRSDIVDSQPTTEDLGNSEKIVFAQVDVDFSDPNIRGASGSVFHAGTDADRSEFLSWIEAGMSSRDATQKLARRIAIESQRAVDTIPRSNGT